MTAGYCWHGGSTAGRSCFGAATPATVATVRMLGASRCLAKIPVGLIDGWHRDPGRVTVAVAYEALGRWTSGFGGSVLYFARVAGSTDLVKVGATMDLKDSLERLQRGNPHPLEYVTALPGTTAHARYLRRRFQPEHRAGGWFQAGPVLSYAEDARVLLSHAVAQDGREALVSVLRELDPAIADLERLWRNGMPVRRIAELTGQSEKDAARGIRWLREMGFDLGYRHMPKAAH